METASEAAPEDAPFASPAHADAPPLMETEEEEEEEECVSALQLVGGWSFYSLLIGRCHSQQLINQSLFSRLWL